MTTYNKDQEYTLKVVNTDNEVKEIKYTPDKDMSKPEMIMALKAKYKNFFKLIESKQIDVDELDEIAYEFVTADDCTIKDMIEEYSDKYSVNEIKQAWKKAQKKNNVEWSEFYKQKGIDTYVSYEEPYSGKPMTKAQWRNVYDKERENGDWNTFDDWWYDMTEKDKLIVKENKLIESDNNIIDTLNNLKDKFLSNLYKDKDKANEVKEQVKQVLQDAPDGTALYRLYKDTSSGWTSHGNYYDERTVIHEYKKENGIWTMAGRKRNDINDAVSAVVFNEGKFMTKEEAEVKRDEEKVNDMSSHRDIVNVGTDSAGNPVGKSINRVDYPNRKTESKNIIDEKSLSDFLGNIDNAWSLDITQTKSNDTKVYVIRRLANSKYTAEDIKNKIEAEFNLNGDITSNNEEIWLSDKKVENKSTEGNSVIVLSYGRGTRFPDRQTAIDYYKECIEGTDPNGSENYSCQNILYELMYTDKDVVYDIDDQTEYDWWVQKGKPTEDISDELLKAHLGESKNMKKEDLSKEEIEELDNYTETEIRKMYDKYCSENKDKKSFEEWQKENVDSALINELEYEFFSNRKKTEDLDIDDKVYEDGFVGQPLSMVLSYIGDGHDIADNDYDGCVVFFPPIDEIDDTDNYDLYVQGLSQILKVTERFDVDDINIVVDIADYVKKNKDTLLDLFEVDGETDDEIMEDLICRVMPNVISGYTTDNVYKLLLNTVKGGK